MTKPNHTQVGRASLAQHAAGQESFQRHISEAVERFYEIAVWHIIRSWIDSQEDPDGALSTLLEQWKLDLVSMYAALRQARQQTTGIVLGDTSKAEVAIVNAAENIIRQGFGRTDPDPQPIEPAGGDVVQFKSEKPN